MIAWAKILGLALKLVDQISTWLERKDIENTGKLLERGSQNAELAKTMAKSKAIRDSVRTDPEYRQRLLDELKGIKKHTDSGE